MRSIFPCRPLKKGVRRCSVTWDPPTLRTGAFKLFEEAVSGSYFLFFGFNDKARSMSFCDCARGDA